MLDLRQSGTAMVTAIVHAGGRATVYRRIGTGVPVVLLLNHEPLALDHVASALSSRYRVISTDIDVPSREFCGWMNSFLDGLAIDDAVVVTEPSRESDVLDFTSQCAGRVRCIYVMDDGPSVANLLGAATNVHRIPVHGDSSDLACRVLRAINEGVTTTSNFQTGNRRMP